MKKGTKCMRRKSRDAFRGQNSVTTRSSQPKTLSPQSYTLEASAVSLARRMNKQIRKPREETPRGADLLSARGTLLLFSFETTTIHIKIHNFSASAATASLV